jgi:hypothetical protein
MCQCGPPPAPLAPYSTSSLNAAAARRPVTRGTHISDYALISDDLHVSDVSLMIHRQREVLPSGSRGKWEWFGPAPQLRPCAPARSSAPGCTATRRSAGQRDVLGPLAWPAATVISTTAEVLTASFACHRLALCLATLRTFPQAQTRVSTAQRDNQARLQQWQGP